MKVILKTLKVNFDSCIQFIQKRFVTLTKPATRTLPIGIITDIIRTKKELIAENALLRQQLIVLNRQLKQPHFKPKDKFLLVLLASWTKTWKQALLIVQPDTLLRWHRQGFKLLWKIKSKPKKRGARISQETIDLIQQMASENTLWGSERIRGELLKLNIRVSKRTIRKYLQPARPVRPTNQNWKTFLNNHAGDIWACDFLPVVDLFFGHLYAFFIVEHSSRRIVHFGVTRHPTDEWTAQQLKEATPFGEGPKYLIRDNDTKFADKFAKVARDAGIEILKTPIRAPKANSICERFQGSVRRECLDHLFIWNERQLYRVLRQYVQYFNGERPHQGIQQAIPQPSTTVIANGKIVSFPVLGGLHHSYKRVA